MLLRRFYYDKLAQASYLVGCQATGEALIVDPKTEHFIGDAEAMKLFKRRYRKPWVTKEEV